MVEVRIDTLPTDMSPEEAVQAAYREDIRWIERKLRQGISVLVECDKQLLAPLITTMRTALRQEVAGRSLGLGIVASTSRGQRRRRRRGGEAGSEGVDEVVEAESRSSIGRMVQDLAEQMAGLDSDTVLVIPHLDLMVTTTKASLDANVRDVISYLYDNPDAVILAFKDPEFEIPEAVRKLFPGLRQIIGIQRDDLPRVILQREARKFGVHEFDPYSLYKYVSGVNAFRIRQILPLFDDRADYSPANPATREAIYSDIRELTLGGGMEVPRVDLERDIGGYVDVKQKIQRRLFDLLDLRDAAQDPAHAREIDEVIPRGILFEGPPGTGKTFFAKAIATKIQAAVIVVSGPELKSQWVGASEQNLRNIFVQARKAAPAVIIFDEIDSFARSRADAEGSGGNVDASMVNTLLTEMDGFKNHADELVFVVGTTNFAKSLDPALLRPGRFKLIINVPAPADDDRRDILDIYRRKYGLAMSDEMLDYLVRKTAGFADPTNRRRFSGDDLHSIMANFRQDAILTTPADRRPISTAEIDRAVAEATIGGVARGGAGEKVSFDDIGGYEDVKKRIDRDILSLLRRRQAETDPRRIERLDKLIPTAILFEGPSGTGKTHFARAIAGVIDAAVMIINAAEFKSKWYGQSQENLREVFAEARKSAPTILVFDEIDAFARARSGGEEGSYGNRTDDEIVNTMLTEMDGFSPTERIIVIGTTNFADSLDPAVRSRFNYVLTIPAPNERDRREILRVMATKEGMEIPDPVLEFMVERTAGIVDRAARRRFSGRDLKEIMKSLARSQALDGPHPVSMEEAEAALAQRTLGGPGAQDGSMPEGYRGVQKLTKEEKAEEERVTALHECGHALIAIALPEASWPYKISIEAPEDAGWLGVTLKEAKEANLSKQNLLADIASALGGRAAERILTDQVTTGAMSDLQAASGLARAMVEELGMSDDLGPVSYGKESRKHEISQRFQEKIDDAVEKILKEQEDRANLIVTENRTALESMAAMLITNRVLDEVDLAKFAAENGWGDRVPKRIKALVDGTPRKNRNR